MSEFVCDQENLDSDSTSLGNALFLCGLLIHIESSSANWIIFAYEQTEWTKEVRNRVSLHLWESAASIGQKQAQFLIGRWFEEGFGPLEKSDSNAAWWFARASGESSPKRTKTKLESDKEYRNAGAERKGIDSVDLFGCGNRSSAIEPKQYKSGYWPAYYRLSLLLENSNGVYQDEDFVLHCLQAPTNVMHVDSIYRMGSIYFSKLKKPAIHVASESIQKSFTSPATTPALDEVDRQERMCVSESK